MLCARSRVLHPLGVVLGVLLSASPAPASSTTFATVYGHGPDKWATAWLLTERVDPDADLVVADDHATLPQDALHFDVPGAEWMRGDGQSTFARVLASRDDISALEVRLARIIHQIEIAFWDVEQSPEANTVERAFRRLQRAEDPVPPECYLAFFDAVVSALADTSSGEPLPTDRLPASCDRSAVTSITARHDLDRPVSEIPLPDVLDAMRAGAEVVIVDVREPGEFAEARIPGAINIPIRELDADAVADLADADLVVSYCVKDFRGYEMAKLIWRAGIERSAIVNPYGLQGWVEAGLPLAGAEHASPVTAREDLDDCLADPACGEDFR